MTIWERDVGRVPTVEEVAERERRYAAGCRVEADRMVAIDADHAALLRLDADLCEMWADEIESGSKLGLHEYRDAISLAQALD